MATLNTWQQQRIARLVVNRLFGTVTGKRIGVLGFTFKAHTNDTRESPAIHLRSQGERTPDRCRPGRGPRQR